MISSFSDLGINDNFVSHLSKNGYVTPTPIQRDSIPLLIENHTDFIGLASTGTGKTAAFAIPLIEKINTSQKQPQALVLCPTRELTQQVATKITSLGSFKGVTVSTIYGGSSYQAQIRTLKKGAHIIVATPGRLIDLMEQNLVDLTKINNLVLDEADEMLSMGFQEALDIILESTKSDENEHRIWLFSATMNNQISRITQRYLTNPETVKLSTGQQTAADVEQSHIMVHEKDKLELLRRLLILDPSFYGLIFCRRREDAANVASYLINAGVPAESIHGDKSQSERERILSNFRQRNIKALVATDVAARGIDIKDLTHVVNYTLPEDTELYIHRIGRTGRNGKTGKAISFVSPSEAYLLERIERVTKQKINSLPIPQAEDIRSAVMKNVWQKLSEKYSNEKIRTRLLSSLSQYELPEDLESLSKKELIGLMLASYEPQILWTKEIETVSAPRRKDSKPRFSRFGGGREGGSRSRRGGDSRRGDDSRRGSRNERDARDDRREGRRDDRKKPDSRYGKSEFFERGDRRDKNKRNKPAERRQGSHR